jgi:hypothetical protein
MYELWTSGRVHTEGGSEPGQTFAADVERHSVVVPPEVLNADVLKWFNNPLPLA